MIGILDTITLARTKLRSKRVLLIITIVVSGLLFGVLSGAIFVSTGISKSITTYFTSSLGNRYLVDVQPNIPLSISSPGYNDNGESPYASASTIAQLTAFQNSYIASQKATYKQFGTPFDASSITPILRPDPFGDKDANGAIEQMVDPSSPVYQLYSNQVWQDYIKTDHGNTDSDLKRIATSSYGATTLYQISQTAALATNAQYLEGGKEDLSKFASSKSPSYSDPIADSVKGSAYTFLDQSILQRFILPENIKRQQNSTAIPVVLASNAIVSTFGKQLNISKKPNSPAAQVNWMNDLQQKVNGFTYTVCYRSPGEATQLQQIIQTNADIIKNKGNSDYTPPDLQYNLPTSPCGDITVKQDKRTSQEKKDDATQIALQKALGTYDPPSHQLLTFQVVGVASISDVYSSLGAEPSDPVSFLSSLLGAEYQNGAFIPQQLYNALPANSQYLTSIQSSSAIGNGMEARTTSAQSDFGEEIVSFPSISDARRFINASCQATDYNCTKAFTASPFGSNYLLIDSLSQIITKTARIALPIAIIIATIIIWITMARVIIDSRRETAVFRALGAKRRDIASVYLVYSLLVALFIVVFMLVLGLIIALVINQLYSGTATDIAKIAYGSFDAVQPFRFIGLNIPLLGALTLCVFIISLIAAIPPLIRNVRRSPIRDMREE